jgi:DNA (cytosine-5)-methyltransferase 1
LIPGLIVDSFAGGGGASLGIELALGRSPDVAINHDPVALAVHQANHPGTRHYPQDVWAVDPVAACAGQPVGLLWLSPDCTHFSRSKGGKPRSRKIRGLAWLAVRWAEAVRPRVICLENVPEWLTWGPLVDGFPCPRRKGQTFALWVGRLRKLGYQIEYRKLSADAYGAPTRRERLFVVARCDGRPIVWPEPTHGPGRTPYRTAAECIDWERPCYSIFLTREEARAGRLPCRRPLCPNTLRRIATGVVKHVLQAGDRAFFVPRFHGERPGQEPRTHSIRRPFPTVVGWNNPQLVSAYLAKHYGGPGGHQTPGADLRAPLPTITGTGQLGPVTVNLSTQGGGQADRVAALLQTYYRTGSNRRPDLPLLTTTGTARHNLVEVLIQGERHVVTDIGMRMLAARELARAQGFPDSYRLEDVIDPAEGEPITKEQQIECVGNSVCPPIAAALVRANCADLAVGRGQLRMWGAA